MSEVAETPTAEKTTDERKELLARSVANHVATGWRVESQTDTQAVMVKGNRTNNTLHLILTIVTFGLWAIVWICLAIFGGEKRMVIEVDAYGHTNRQR